MRAALNPTGPCPYEKETWTRTDTWPRDDRQRLERCVTAEESLGPPRQGEARRYLSSGSQREPEPAGPSTLDFSPPEPQGNKFLLYSASQFVELCFSI